MNWLNNILLLLTALLAVFAESAFDLTRHLLGAQIDVLPALMVYASLTGDLVTLAVVAIGGGLCFDALSANPLGASVLPLFGIGFAIQRQRALILRDQRAAQWVLGLLASAGVPALTLLVLLSAGQTPLLGWGTLWQWLVVSATGALLTPAVFRFFDLVRHTFNYQPATETSFRPDREIRRGRQL